MKRGGMVVAGFDSLPVASGMIRQREGVDTMGIAYSIGNAIGYYAPGILARLYDRHMAYGSGSLFWSGYHDGRYAGTDQV